MSNMNSVLDLAHVLSRWKAQQPSLEVNVSFSGIKLKGFVGKVIEFSNEEVHIQADGGTWVKLPIRDVKWEHSSTADLPAIVRREMEREGIASSLEVRIARHKEQVYSIAELEPGEHVRPG